MKARLILAAVVVALLAAPTVTSAQTGEIFGKVTDTSGGVMPGVTVTLTSPVLLQPQAAVTSETGSYRFPLIPIGLYTVTFELTGFKKVVREGIRIELGFNAQINATLEISAVEETITVSGESPIVDTRDTSKSARLTQETLQGIPSARDPWVMLEQTPAIAVDRSNVGGSQSGQQSNFVARGAAFSQQKWNLDGVDITDMSATGGSPVYFDFDAFEEMQISTGGADVQQMTPGVGINLVTKSGTDKLRGSGRFYVTDDNFEAVNTTDELRLQGATSGNPIQNIKDYGLEVGGPIKRGRAWFWGSYGEQNIKAGVNNFYKPDATCQAMKADLKKDPLSHPIDEVWGCLNADQTQLKNYNAKVAVETIKNNQLAFYFNMAGKIRNARDASDLRPIETTYRQKDVSPDSGLGSKWWKTGLPKTYKWSDRHIFSDRLLMELQYAHVGNNFVLDFHEDALAEVQGTQELYSPAGLYGRSYTRSIYVRPTDSIDYTGSYFLPGFLGGDHAFKFGAKIRNDVAHSEGHRGGNALDYLAYGEPYRVRLYRDSYSEYQLRNRNFYIQDSFSKQRMTVNVGIRFDYQTDESRAGVVPQNPFFGQATFAGTMTYCTTPIGPNECRAGRTVTYTVPGDPMNQLPAAEFGGAKAMNDKGYGYKNWSPRIGFTYDVTGDGKNVAKFSYARYASQAGTGDLSSSYTTTGSQAYVQYPWVDDGDLFVQANEIVMIPVPLASGGNYDYKNPGALATPVYLNDPNIQMEHTDEFVVSFDRQIGSDFAAGASYIWRKSSNFRWSWTTDDTFDMNSWTSANYAGPSTFVPTPSTCPSGSHCEPVEYFSPTSPEPSFAYYTNNPTYYRKYQGVELYARKRMSKNWMMNASFSYNDAPAYYPPGSYQDPTNIPQQDGGQYAPQSTSSGIDNVFVNAQWIARLSGAYQLPWWQIGVAGFLNTRGGFPLEQFVRTGDRGNGASTADVYLATIGDVRLPSVMQLDLRVDKQINLGTFRATASVDMFNLLNGNTILAERRQQNSTNANTVSAILAPRVLRFGVRVTF